MGWGCLGVFYCEGDETLQWVAWRGGEVSVLGGSQNLIRHDPGQPAIDGPALSRGVRLDDLQSCLQPSTIL